MSDEARENYKRSKRKEIQAKEETVGNKVKPSDVVANTRPKGTVVEYRWQTLCMVRRGRWQRRYVGKSQRRWKQRYNFTPKSQTFDANLD